VTRLYSRRMARVSKARLATAPSVVKASLENNRIETA
jgi:hypothetical protein